jgi:uncharacterized DUF497 family protein
MEIEFDPAKDAANRSKHGVSLTLAAEFEFLAIVSDDRFDEPRFRAYGRIGETAYVLAFTLRGAVLRAISLRRAHRKEFRRYVP